MNILVCEPAGGVWEWRENGRSKDVDCPFAWPCSPCAGKDCIAFCCACERECLCLKSRDLSIISRMPAVPGIRAMLFSPCERYLYQLSSEADCIHTRSTATGELLYAAPAGVFPQSLQMDSRGKLLLCAGGAVNEACLFTAPELHTEQVITTRHACFAADFWRGGLALVCAAEGDDIRTIVYTLAPGKVRPAKILELSGQPGALCVCADGEHAMLSTRDGLCKLRLETGQLCWNQPEWAMSLKIESAGSLALVSDTLDGSVWLFNHHRPWERQKIACREAAQACFAPG